MVHILEDKQIISIVLVIVIEHTDLDDNIWFDTISPICYSFFFRSGSQGTGGWRENSPQQWRGNSFVSSGKKEPSWKAKFYIDQAVLCPDPNLWTCRTFGLCLRHGEEIPEEPGEVAGTSRSLLNIKYSTVCETWRKRENQSQLCNIYFCLKTKFPSKQSSEIFHQYVYSGNSYNKRNVLRLEWRDYSATFIASFCLW